MFEELQRINERPAPFSRCTLEALWAAPHTSEQMLRAHLDGTVDLSSRRTELIEAAVSWMSSTFHLASGVTVADFGCGPGLYANRLARTGADVTGIDFSARSIEYARDVADREGLSASYVNADYLEYDTDRRYDLITMIFCDFCALSPGQRTRLLAKIKGLLNRGGAFLFDVHSLAAYERKGELATYGLAITGGFWSAHPYFWFLNTFKYDAEKVTLDKYEIVEDDRDDVYYNWLQYFDPEILAAELGESGFELGEIFADVAGGAFDPASSEFAVIARSRDSR